MPARHEELLARWVEAGLLDPADAERIRAFEARREARRTTPGGLRWPAWIAIALGTLALGAGVLLFVSAHWDTLAPPTRFAVLLGTVAGFHLAGAALAPRHRALAVAAHTLGTASLGAGVFLAGQIFHLREHWATGLLLWALGAWAGWAILRDWPQGLLAALLTPAWLVGEWTAATRGVGAAGVPALAGLLLLALVYLDAERNRRTDLRRAMVWAGGIAVIPLALALAIVAHDGGFTGRGMGAGLRTAGWIGAFAAPLVVAAALHRRLPVAAMIAAVWVAAGTRLDLVVDVLTYLWAAVGAVGLAAWGVRDGHAARVNLGTAGFALTLLLFYFSEVMDRLGRSLSLVGLGVLLLAGGYALERARRRLVADLRERSA